MTPPPAQRCAMYGHPQSIQGAEPLNPDGSPHGGFVGYCDAEISNEVGHGPAFCPCEGFEFVPPTSEGSA